MNRIIALCLLFLLNSSRVLAQSSIADVQPQSSGVNLSLPQSTEPPRCAHDHAKSLLLGRNPLLQSSENTMNNALRAVRSGNRGASYTISVVVHVIHQNGEENISDEQIEQAISDLNDAFANEGAYQDPGGVNTNISFCLAQQDPNGLPTNGITRYESILTDLNFEGFDLALKSIVRWDPLRYLNIWLVREIYSPSLGYGVAGYAYLPFSHGMPEDGIVNEARWFGSSPQNSAIHIHEAGHYLGLYHTFEGGCQNNDCTMEGDLVCDTPPDANTGFGSCDQVVNSCFSDEDDTSTNNPFRNQALGGLGDQPDLTTNYMDYSNQACQTLFTQGQANRMTAALEGIRHSLLDSDGCFSSCGIGSAMLQSAQEEYLFGEIWNFNHSTAALVPIDVQWLFNGGVVGTENILNFTASGDFVSEGELVLRVMSESGDCISTDTLRFDILCNPPARIVLPDPGIEVNELVSFSSQYIAPLYTWILDGEIVGNNQSLDISFPASSEHLLVLVTGDGVCTDTSAIDYFSVGDCFSGNNNKWIIGGGMEIDFSTSEPVVTVTAAYGPTFNQSIEGIATVCDANGELILFSDGNVVYNGQLDTMFVMSGAGVSSAQGIQFVQDPGNANHYYAFTCENFGGILAPTFRGFSYIKIDVTANNGQGAAITPYFQLLPQVCERQTAVRHCNGHDVWVITQGFPDLDYRAYLITDSGVSDPVISANEEVLNPSDFSVVLGQFKARPQGDLLAVSYPYYGPLDLLRFDNETGEVSSDVFDGNFYTAEYGYGIEFSPDGSKLYVASEYGNTIRQLDLSSGNNDIINASVSVVGTSNRPIFMGSLELARNGKVYAAQAWGSALDVIHFPNEAGQNCGFQTSGVQLPGNVSFGLQNIPSFSHWFPKPEITGPTNVCAGLYNVEYSVSCGSQYWIHSGSNVATMIDDRTLTMDFLLPGQDTLVCVRWDACLGNLYDTLIIHVTGFDFSLGDDLSICESGMHQLFGPPGFVSYEWSNGMYTNEISVSEPGIYWLKVTGLGGCTATDTVLVATFSGDFEVETPSVYQCPGNFTTYVPLPAPTGNFEHHWYTPNGPTMDTLLLVLDTSTLPQQVDIFYVNEQGCIVQDAMVIESHSPFIPFELQDEIFLCEGMVETVEIDTENYPNSVFIWPNGVEADSYTFYQFDSTFHGSNLIMQIDTLCGNVHYEFVTVWSVSQENLQLPDSLWICENQVTTLNAGWSFVEYVWQDGSTGFTHDIVEPGIYSVSLIVPCGVFRDTCVVMQIDISDMDLGLVDTMYFCDVDLPVFLPSPIYPFYNIMWSNNMNGWQVEEGQVFLTAEHQCGTVYDSTYIRLNPSPEVTVPNLITLCDDTQFTVLQMPDDQFTTWNGELLQDSLMVFESDTIYYTTSIGNGCDRSGQVTVFFSDLYLVAPDTVLCKGDSLLYLPQTNGSFWAWVGMNAPMNNTISSAGMYYIYANDGFCTIVEEVDVQWTSPSNETIELPDMLSVCSDALPIEVSAEADDAVSFLWSNGGQQSTVWLDSTGWYAVEVRFRCVTLRDSVWIEGIPGADAQLPSEAVLCKDAVLNLSGPAGYTYMWSNGEQTQSIDVEQAGWYILTIERPGECSGTDSVLVSLSDLYLILPDSIAWCEGQTGTVEAETNASALIWSHNQLGSSATFEQTGLYSATASLDGCFLLEVLRAVELDAPLFGLGNDTTVSEWPLTLAGPTGSYEYTWLPSGSTPDLMVYEEGWYVLQILDSNGCAASDSIYVRWKQQSNDSYIEVPGFLQLSGEGLFANYRNINASDVKVFDAAGRLVCAHRSFPWIWDGRMGGGEAAVGIYYYRINYQDMQGRAEVFSGKFILFE